MHMKEATLKFGLKTISWIIGDVDMTKNGEIYYCEICGNKVQVLESGVGKLVCCGQPMKLVDK